MRSAWLWMMIGCLCLALTNAWGAEETANRSVIDKRFTIYGGARFYQADGEFSSTMLKNTPYAIGMDELGLDKNETSAIAGFTFNFAERWNLRFDYFGYHDEALRTIGRQISFANVSFPIGASVSTSLDMDLYVLNLAYNIVHTQKARFGLGLGVHGINFDMKLSGRAFIGNLSVPVGEGQEDFIAPIPNVWAHGAYALTDSIIFKYGGGWMSAGYDEYDGKLLLANAALEYWPFQNAGFGLGYHYITADIDRDGGGKKENYDVDLSGFVLYLTLGF